MSTNERKKYTKINVAKSMLLRALHQESGVPCSELVKRYPQHAERTIYRHATATSEDTVDKRKYNKGKPKKINERGERLIVRTLHRLRGERASFSAKKIQEETELTNVSVKTIHRVLKKNGYSYLQSRKKGLVSSLDKKKRLKFAREMKKKPCGFWSRTICFYFDGVGFAHRTNPYSEARAVSSMTWRKPAEGTDITTKGRKEGSCGKMANFFVAVSHGSGVVLCEQHEKVTGQMFADFVLKNFGGVFEKLAKGKLWLQDGDPRQNSKVAKTAWQSIGAEMFGIPARSPDLNPIENMFHMVRRQLKDDAIEKKIEHEKYDQFCKRVKDTIESMDVDYIDKTIASMPQRIDAVIKCKGGRTKY